MRDSALECVRSAPLSNGAERLVVWHRSGKATPWPAKAAQSAALQRSAAPIKMLTVSQLQTKLALMGRCPGLVCGSPFRAQNPGRVSQMYGTVEAPVRGLGVIARLPLPCPVCPPTWWMGALSSIPVSPFTG